jgi:hypothetical protein
MKRLIALALFGVLAALPACRERPLGLIVGTGTIQYGGGGECTGVWIVHDDSGREYELISLAAEFRDDGLRVRFALRKRPVVSTCMRWETADVVSMTKL